MAQPIPDPRRRYPPHPRSETARICQTFESLVVAFILAFIFRAFIIEAFVIPTGSMAATLYGAHLTFVCPNCGYEYAFGFDRQPYQLPRVVCPNCQTEILNPTPRQSRETGDRILVFKFPFDLGGAHLGPRRWDVVVFKNPGDGQQNYIKRLIGLPAEVLEILDGDIYVAPADTLRPSILHKLSQPRWARPPLTRDEQQELDAALRIQQKHPQAQESLCFVVYDQDYPTTRRRLAGEQPPWQPLTPDRSAWQQHPSELFLDGLDQPLDQLAFTAKKVTDFYAYNGQRGLEEQIVSDLSLRAVLIPHAGQGYLRVELSKRDDVFRFDLHCSGRLDLVHLTSQPPGRLTELQTCTATVQPLQPDTPVQVAFTNIDHHARLELDGRTVLSMPWPADAAEVRRLGPETTPPQIRIGAANARLTLRHLVLQRDVYYRSPPIQEPRDAETGLVNTTYMEAPGWGTAANPIYLRQDEYFVLGDNSPQSLDSRLWWHACALLEPARPLQQLLAQHRQNLLAGRPVDPDPLRRYLRDLRRTLDTAPAYRLPELQESFTNLADHLQQHYIPALGTDPDRALQSLAELQRLLADIDWRYYHLGTVQRDQLIGRAFFVYWPAGVAFLDTLWRCIPNVGQMRLVY